MKKIIATNIKTTGITLLIGLSILCAQPECLASDENMVFFSLEDDNTTLRLNNEDENLIGISAHLKLPKDINIEEVITDPMNLSMYKLTPKHILIVGISSKNYVSLDETPLDIKLNSRIENLPVLNKLRLFHYKEGEIVVKDIVSPPQRFRLFAFILCVLVVLFGFALLLSPLYREQLKFAYQKLKIFLQRKNPIHYFGNKS